MQSKLPLMRRSFESRNSPKRGTASLTTRNNSKKHDPIRFLRPINEKREGSMDAYTGAIGNPAKLEFYDTYINLPQFSQRNRQEKLEDSPNLAYLDVVDKHKLKPNPFGIIRRKGPETSIDIHSYSMGDAYATAFSEGIKHLKDVGTLNLKSNRLSDSGAAQILTTLEYKNTKKIILSDNKISIRSIDMLVKLIKSNESKLKVLELENTHMSEKSVNNLCRVISEDKRLTKLSLAKNNIGQGSTKALAEMLKYNQTLKYLDLHWNCIGISSGGTEFLEGLGSNDCLLHVDLSYNSFGRSDGLATAQAFAKTFSMNQFLQHVDLSNNYFNKKESEVIGEGLKDNHMIFGLHMQGNDCVIDSKGYVVPLDYQNKTEQGHLHRRLMEVTPFKLRNRPKINCWICEKWVEVSIIYKTPTDTQLFIHLDCDNYQQAPMTLVSDHHSITRMAPPGMLKFFFSDSETFMTSKDYKTMLLDIPIKIEFPGPDNTKNYISISKVNIIFIEPEPWNSKELPSVKPRNDPRIKLRTEMIIEKIPWNIENSSFKDYKFDTEELLASCLDYDVDVSNIKEILPNKDDQDEIKALLKDNYRLITGTFRQLSGISGITLFSIGKNILNDFVKKCNLVNEEFNIQEIAILWNLSNAPQSKGEAYNAGNGLCRYEFAEFLVRLAIDRFYKTKKCESIKESFLKLFHDHVTPAMEKIDDSRWRTEKYLTEDVDHFFKLHKAVLESVYYKYSAMGKGPVDLMNLQEFRIMCNEAGLCNDKFVMREINTKGSLRQR
jgi:NLR family CARD domain-containing protein 3